MSDTPEDDLPDMSGYSEFFHPKVFVNFDNKMGLIGKVIAPTKADFARYDGRLPRTITDYWRRYGFATFPKARCQLVNPAWYERGLATWLKGTEFETKDDYHVVVVSAFGKVRVWGERTGRNFYLDIMKGTIELAKGDDSERIQKYGAEDWASGFVYQSVSIDLFDTRDDHGPMFPRARKKLGPLEPNELYAFVPALPLGGEWSVDNLERLDGGIHLDILGKLAPPRIVTFEDTFAKYGPAGMDVINKAIDGK